MKEYIVQELDGLIAAKDVDQISLFGPNLSIVAFHFIALFKFYREGMLPLGG